ncbi:MAG: 1,4-alpha-glucan branching protein GlgB [Chitinophagales bacterium]|nr:1,4-alpha-glucan branching protein GlgB [Chitinophagales bacterium]
MAESVVYGFSLLTDYDIHLFREGKHYHLWEKLGSHIAEYEGKTGVYFAVWAPNAEAVFVMGDYNQWDKKRDPLQVRWDASGIWEGFITGIEHGDLYKYNVVNAATKIACEKADPFAMKSETAPGTASFIYNTAFKWNDKAWLRKRKKMSFEKPVSIYELHPGSWGRREDGGYFTYRELAVKLVPYIKSMGFTHVEFMPVMEHPFYGSWGYQITNYFAPTSRYGDPDDLKYLIEAFHKDNIGVILDWVPSHFPDDAHGLIKFDGTSLYEHEDRKKGFQPDWNSYIFNYGRHEVKSFLISNALYWLEEFHIDGLRVDAVASMLYLDYSRKEGEWLPNEYGGNENLEAVEILKEFNQAVRKEYPDVITIAEESTAWPGVTKKVEEGGLGFHYKWMMGWMHDILDYFKREPIYRKYHQDQLTFSMWYFYNEHFLVSISHDEVVYGKGSMLHKMPGDDWHKFANLRLLFAYMFTHPGPKLIFMGSEFAQRNEWNHDQSLDWNLITEQEDHKKMQQLVQELNHLYKYEKALHQKDFEESGFIWTDIEHKDECIMCYKRVSGKEYNYLQIVVNFDQQTNYDYPVKVSEDVSYIEIFNTDAEIFGGSGLVNDGILIPVEKICETESEFEETNESGETNVLKKLELTREYYLHLLIAPLTEIILKPAGKNKNTPEINKPALVN